MIMSAYLALDKLKQYLQDDQNIQNQLEQYIVNKNPTSVADVEYWANEGMRKLFHG